MVTAKWLFSTFPDRRVKARSTVRRKSKKIGGLSWPKPLQKLRSVVWKFWALSSLASYVFLLGAYVPDQTDSSCERLRFCTRANVGMLFAFEWWRVKIDQEEIFASLVPKVCTANGVCRKPSENVNRLASYSFADFRKATGYFHSHLCLRQYFTRAKFAWPRKRPLLSTHAFSWS